MGFLTTRLAALGGILIGAFTHAMPTEPGAGIEVPYNASATKTIDRDSMVKRTIVPDDAWFTAHWTPMHPLPPENTPVGPIPDVSWYSYHFKPTHGDYNPPITITSGDPLGNAWGPTWTGIQSVYLGGGLWISGDAMNTGVCLNWSHHCGIAGFTYLCCYFPGQDIPCRRNMMSEKHECVGVILGKREDGDSEGDVIDAVVDDQGGLEDEPEEIKEVVSFAATLHRLETLMRSYPKFEALRDEFVQNAEALNATDPVWTTEGEMYWPKNAAR